MACGAILLIFTWIKNKPLRLFALIGYPLGHSFSQTYFHNKFEREGITGCEYRNFPLPSIQELPAMLRQHPQLAGFNVTIPYKQKVLQYVHEITNTVAACGAANCIQVQNGRLTACNTDVIGFEQSLKPLLRPHHTRALVLGTGGAARAVTHVLERLGIGYRLVSRTKAGEGPVQTISYHQVNNNLLSTHTLIINATPLGMWPNTAGCPEIPYHLLGPQHLLYDLIYKPETTLFLQLGADRGATVKNGYEMLVLQAEASWNIWNQLQIAD